MMLNLFSIFDFYTIYYLINNWVSSFLGLFLLPQFFWFMKFRLFFWVNFMMKILWNEFIIIMKLKFNVNNLLYFIVLFFFIMMNNFMGLFPYIFTSSSHLVYSLVFSLSMWLGLMFFGWGKNITFMFIHLVPQGTPFFLMFFMVLIELLSSLIRPLTLGIRLTANMIAGHLLLVLLGSFTPNIFNLVMFSIMFSLNLMLFMLEFGVSVIQAYVFVILMILYLKETN